MLQASLIVASAVSLLTGAALAQSPPLPTVTLILPQIDAQTILAEVLSEGPTATEYFLACPTGEDAVDCGLGHGATVIEGPSTLEWHMTEESLSVSLS